MTIETRLCHCGEPIEYIPIRVLDQVFQAEKCERCYAADAPPIQQPKPLDPTGWDKICPPTSAYRMTDPAKLPNQKKSEEAMTWTFGRTGLLMHGPTGAGKTRTLYLILKREFDAGRRITLFSPGSFAKAVDDAFNAWRGPTWVKGVSSRDILAWDDFGKVPMTPRQEGAFFSILEARTSGGLPCLFTMNKAGDGISSDLRNGEEVVRRMRQFCFCIYFGGATT